MKIGIPKEIKPQEARVGVTPAGALSLIQGGHEVHVQKDAGLLSGFTDNTYQKVGCTIKDNIEDIYHFAEMIIKVKEPVESEYSLIKPNQLLSTYLDSIFATFKEKNFCKLLKLSSSIF